MARTKRTKIDLTIGSLLPGRMVRTVGFSRGLVTTVSTHGCQFTGDTNSWCNAIYSVMGLSEEKRNVIKLGYLHKGSVIAEIEWPITGLSKAFGIQI